jgi:hypothetical protein
MGINRNVYAMYKGEECLGIGTLWELEKTLKISRKTLYFYSTPTYKKRVKKSKNRRELIKI